MSQIIQPGATYSCNFTRSISGNAGTVHTNTVTASGMDNDTSPVSGQGSATVTITAPRITVTKVPSLNSVPSGTSVLFTVSIRYNGSTGTVSITSLTDSIFGNLDGEGTCDVPWTISHGQTETCSFFKTIVGVPGSNHDNTVTASGQDGQGSVSGQASASVAITGASSGAQSSGLHMLDFMSGSRATK